MVASAIRAGRPGLRAEKVAEARRRRWPSRRGAGFPSPHEDRHLVVTVVVVDLVSSEILRGEALEEGSRRQHVATAFHRDVPRSKSRLEQGAGGQGGEVPAPVSAPVLVMGLADAGERGQ